MGYIALYRKYRPANLQEVIGQKAVTQTLINALEKKQIHHAYLFCGPRGTGKTSVARAFAKAINCHEGPTANPCGVCISCERNQKGNSLDVIEIDAASNRGIDEIRALKEIVSFSPSEGQYKIYIIDEVHMLTKGAFNAFLKTLEEPPPNVIFLLATTEPHQVLPTILSRCQRFDFRLLLQGEILTHLSGICEKEGVEAEAAALEIIAASAHGGLRDAMSTLDQAIAFGGGKVKESEVYELLGKVDYHFLQEIVLAATGENTGKLLSLFHTASSEGKDPQQLLFDISTYLRNALIIKECGIDSSLVELTREAKEAIVKAMQNLDQSLLLDLLDILTEMSKEMRFSNQPYLLLELLGVKLTSRIERGFGDRIKALEDKVVSLARTATLGKSLSSVKGTASQPVRKEVLLNDTPKESRVNEKEKAKEKLTARTAEIDLEEIKEDWPNFLSYVQGQRKPRLIALLEGVAPYSLKDDELILALDFSWREKSLAQFEEFLELCLKNYFKNPFVISYVVSEEKPKSKKNKSTNSSGGGEREENFNPQPSDMMASSKNEAGEFAKEDSRASSSLKQHPLVQEVVKMFDGEIVEE